MEENPVTIVKNGKLINIDEMYLCKNDTVVLQSGDMVPADLRLTETTGIEADEFYLTGELMPVLKKVQDNAMLYKGSRIIKGSGKGTVVATGDETEYGKVLRQIRKQNEAYKFRFIKNKYFIPVALLAPTFAVLAYQSPTPGFIILFYLLLSAALMLLQNDEFFSNMIVSNETKKYERCQIRVCDTTALESLNRVDIICFDKTGVLTTRQMEVKNIYYAAGSPNAAGLSNKDKTPHLVKIACALCNDVLFFEKLEQANAIDKALISFAGKNGIDIKKLLPESKRIYDKPFDSENRYMACGYELKDFGVCYFAKGDPDVVLKMCDSYLVQSGRKKAADSDFWLFRNDSANSIIQRGNTAIALAYASGITDISNRKYTFLCMLELENSLQPGVRETIKKITEKGIRSIMLTGDRAETAVNISKECGIAEGPVNCLTGKEINRMALSEVSRQSAHCSVFARLLPSQKGIIIRLFQQRDHYVAMIGDGPNDGIALKAADIGISFVKNSSPIARRISKILINQLTDLPRLIEGADRIKRNIKLFKLLRVLILAIILLDLYFVAAGLIGINIEL